MNSGPFKTILLVFMSLLIGFSLPLVAFGEVTSKDVERMIRNQRFEHFQANSHVRSLDDLRLHFITHIVRVTIIGEYILKTYYPSVDRLRARRHFLSHDSSKVNFSKAFVTKYKINPKAHPFLGISMFYGIPLDRLSTQEREVFNYFRDELNRVDGEVANDSFEHEKLLVRNGKVSLEGMILEKVVHLSDILDRGMSSVSIEEFKRAMAPASLFLQTPEEVRIAKAVEAKFHELVGHVTIQSAKDMRMQFQYTDSIETMDRIRKAFVKKTAGPLFCRFL